ncbi:hypothetical protein PHLGIDRAFT_17435 [Phlebiopsis gigantea 11061_1 CR5-6]|uniref:Uncharacterized protein n=1 Tax=Phlebiopsis gigantea (strain 11061_1 CR5-6) TaxID=745531 RepID=A0A0C3N9F0_PHLG1|nr:hypothetical protein PHLGIDRAFT_17435 [Phlebiopsis gigantea 11061_1 CR5-6]
MYNQTTVRILRDQYTNTTGQRFRCEVIQIISGDGGPPIQIVFPPQAASSHHSPLPLSHPRIRPGAYHDHLLKKLVLAGYVTSEEVESYRDDMRKVLSAKLAAASNMREPQGASVISNIICDDTMELVVALIMTAAQRQGAMAGNYPIGAPHFHEPRGLCVTVSPTSPVGSSLFYPDHFVAKHMVRLEHCCLLVSDPQPASSILVSSFVRRVPALAAPG